MWDQLTTFWSLDRAEKHYSLKEQPLNMPLGSQSPYAKRAYYSIPLTPQILALHVVYPSPASSHFLPLGPPIPNYPIPIPPPLAQAAERGAMRLKTLSESNGFSIHGEHSLPLKSIPMLCGVGNLTYMEHDKNMYSWGYWLAGVG